MSKVLVDRELMQCPFCGGKPRLDQRVTQSLWNSGDATFSNVSCDECDVTGQDFCDDPSGEEAIEWWNRRSQPAEAEGVDFGFDDRSVKVSQEAYSIFMERERHHLAALSAVTAERDRLLAEAEALRVLLGKSLPIVEAHAGASHMLEGFRPKRNKWDELVDGIRATMAEKDADKTKKEG